MSFRNHAYRIMGNHLLAVKAASPFVPFTNEALMAARDRGDVLVYVPQMSLNDVVDRHRDFFTGDIEQYRTAGFMRASHEAAWWLVSIGPFVSESVSTTPRRAPALVFAYACAKYQEGLGKSLFTGIVTTDCRYHGGGPILHGDPFQTVVVEVGSEGIRIATIFERALHFSAKTAYGIRGSTL